MAGVQTSNARANGRVINVAATQQCANWPSESSAMSFIDRYKTAE